MSETRRTSLGIPVELDEWLSFAASLRDTSVNGYLISLVEEDREAADDATVEAFKAWSKARRTRK